MEIHRDEEIRNLDVSVTQRLANFFEGDDSILSLLMGNIVRDFENQNSELRFTSTDIDSIRNHAQLLRRSPILILLDEWGTMGRNRPKVHHLLTLLIKCKLFRAADYIAKLIGEPSPSRPDSGPAARIDISLPDDVESALNGMSYPFSAEEANRENRNIKPTMNTPNINFAASNDSKVNNISIPFIKPPSSNFNPDSDLIKFSARSVSTRAATSTNGLSTRGIFPVSSAVQQSNNIPMTVNSEASIASQELPALGTLLINGDSQTHSHELPAVLSSINNASSTEASHSNANLPVFSQIMGSDSSSQNFRPTSSGSSAGTDSDDSDTNKQ